MSGNDYITTVHFGEESPIINKKVIVLLIVIAVCCVFIYRLETAPPLADARIDVSVIIYQTDSSPPKRSVERLTTASNSTLNLWRWVIFGQTEYISGGSKILKTEFLTWEEYQKGK